MSKLIQTSKKQEKAILVAVVSQQDKIETAEEYLDELAFLTLTAGARVTRRFLQRLPHPHPKTYVGEGKLKEIAAWVKEHEIDLVIFDDELSPSQIRNIEQEIKCKILDRSNLILDIFATRARTAQAKFQVELAQAQYLLPRLTRMWTHLSKQKGGIGMKGPGETEIETDRRALRNKILKLKERLDVINRQNTTRRLNRNDKARVALVGYTNVGKSSLLNLLAKSDVLAENKLFATLDATVRKIVWDEKPFLLTDTVGFIRKLPHQLIECFKSTLDEITEADLLVHVVDISHPQFEEQIEVVKETLAEIHAAKTPSVLVFNKIDLWIDEVSTDDYSEEPKQLRTLEWLKKTWMAKVHSPVVFISVEKKMNIADLREAILKELDKLPVYAHR